MKRNQGMPHIVHRQLLETHHRTKESPSDKLVVAQEKHIQEWAKYEKERMREGEEKKQTGRGEEN